MANFKKRSRDAGNDGPAVFAKTSRKFSIVQKIFLLALVVQICAAGSLKAQWANFGSGLDGANNSISSVQYTDNLREPVTALSVSGTYNLMITTSASSNPGFADSDRIIIVDMAPTTNANRNYDLAVITGVGVVGGFFTITAKDAKTAAGGIYVSTSPVLEQVIKVPQWSSVSFASGGQLTCHAWNGSTGGILAFCVSGTLDLSLGDSDLIYADGLGETGKTAHAGGNPGTAKSITATNGAGGTAPGGNGVNGESLNYCGDPTRLDCGSFNPYRPNSWGWRSWGNAGTSLINGLCFTSANYGGYGGCGAHANDGEGPFPAVNSTFPSSSHSNLFMIFGYGGSSGLSGQGAGAGGNGGGGGASGFNGNSGGAGLAPGGSHPAGGTGGTGGTGGGLVYIKANAITGPSTTTHVISARGTAGSTAAGTVSGTNGAGGNGGNGGAGGNAGCIGATFYAMGGGGGYGEGGNGADGGGGGNGGPGGGVWIGYNTLTHFSSSYVNNKGGAGGGDQIGGNAGVNATQGSDGATGGIDLCNPPNTTFCGGLGCLGPTTSWGTAVPGGGGGDCEDYWLTCIKWDSAFKYLCFMRNQQSFTDPYGNMGTEYYNPDPSMINYDARDYCIVTDSTLIAYVYKPGTSSSCTGPGVDTLTAYEAAFDPGSIAGMDCYSTLNGNFWSQIATIGTVDAGVWNPGTAMATYNNSMGMSVGTYMSNQLITSNGNCLMAAFCDVTIGYGKGDGGYVYIPDYGRPRAGLTGPAGNPGPTGEVDVPAMASGNDGGSDPSSPAPRGNGLQPSQTGQQMQMMGGQAAIDPNNNMAQNLNLHPNPTSDNVYLEFGSAQAGNYTINVTDITGKEVYSHSFEAIAGENNHTIDVRNLAAGTYIVNVRNGFGVQKIKFEKQ